MCEVAPVTDVHTTVLEAARSAQLPALLANLLMERLVLEGRPGLDIAALVRGTLYDTGVFPSSHLTRRLSTMVLNARSPHEAARPEEDLPATYRLFGDAQARLMHTRTGRIVFEELPDVATALDALSWLSVEVLYEYLATEYLPNTGLWPMGNRFLNVPGSPEQNPALLVMTPTLSDVSQTRRLTNEVELDPYGLWAAFDRLRPYLTGAFNSGLGALLRDGGPAAGVELLWISQPEIILTRRPRMIPTCAPHPFVRIQCGSQTSSAGVYCTDPSGEFGVSACFHGTGPVGTPVSVGSQSSYVKLAEPVQDIVFIPLNSRPTSEKLRGAAGVRDSRAPSEAEPVSFEGAGTGTVTTTHVTSHDAGVLRRRPAVQLKVQTPADTNTGDSGSALIDEFDQVLGFAFERTGIGEYPELTDWVWAANALAALGLTPFKTGA